MGEVIAEKTTTRKSTFPSNDKEGKERETTKTRGNSVKTDAMTAVVDDACCSSSPTLLASSSSFWSRKLDGIYLGFFMVHIPIILRTYIPARGGFFSLPLMMMMRPSFLSRLWIRLCIPPALPRSS